MDQLLQGYASSDDEYGSITEASSREDILGSKHHNVCKIAAAENGDIPSIEGTNTKRILKRPKLAEEDPRLAIQLRVHSRSIDLGKGKGP